ncbi:50S ribosomal protein L13 [Pectobacterium zantedeschiae]|uniref:50S ribosomal protein L13 n=1 Tax=Pectobacterium zantedeschiae TaxID=2034769 RepID=A0A9X8P5L4_9GAMM|nr:50S ribosomal protein L13 [Pectobacterium zantedeschiae]RYC44607.1 50S ribosomal protein L13 [Pectobacterium zantedeschiae]RYC49765.1 50S ribosomal protein L13 [Pectobacterium zantedeschiae]
MEWTSVAERQPKAFARVWVLTDTNRQTTGFVEPNVEWHINCQRIRATGAAVLSWKE